MSPDQMTERRGQPALESLSVILFMLYQIHPESHHIAFSVQSLLPVGL